MAKIKDLHRVWSKAPAYQGAYDALDDEFQLARVLIDTRSRAGLSQAELAVRMKTSQTVHRAHRRRAGASVHGGAGAFGTGDWHAPEHHVRA